ncbi:MAG TPA: sugar phosphate isomerase/epimerase family protein [Limnochordia bacterium]|nr:sugar phosphate isomerase/epimerase family protein [Limnochordia bacterium]
MNMKIGITQIITGRRTLAETLGLCERAGYEAIELVFGEGRDPDVNLSDAEIAAVGRRVRDAGVEIASVIAWYKDRGSLLSPNAEEQQKGLKSLRRAVEIAGLLGVDATLLHPGQLSVNDNYADAWRRLVGHLQAVAPAAQAARVRIGLENVWNKFLLSPTETSRFVDEVASEWVGAYLDTANMMAYGFPEHWIDELGPRIVKVHVKDFKRGEHRFVPLGDGDTDWPRVIAHLQRIGYTGPIIHEIDGDDELQLEMARRMRKIVAGEKP